MGIFISRVKQKFMYWQHLFFLLIYEFYLCICQKHEIFFKCEILSLILTINVLSKLKYIYKYININKVMAILPLAQKLHSGQISMPHVLYREDDFKIV